MSLQNTTTAFFTGNNVCRPQLGPLPQNSLKIAIYVFDYTPRIY